MQSLLEHHDETDVVLDNPVFSYEKNQLEKILRDVLALPPEERADQLDRLCASDPALREVVEPFLRGFEDSADPAPAQVVCQG